MPYVAPGPSSQCLPRKAVASTVLEQTRRKAAADKGNSSRSGEKEIAERQSQALASHSSNIRVQGTVPTAELAEALDVVHTDEPGVPIPKSASSSSLGPSSSEPASHTSSSSISPTLSSDPKQHVRREAEDPVSAYKAALYSYTRDKLLDAQGRGAGSKKGSMSYSQFGSKQSGMQKLAAKKALARQLNA